MNRWIEEILEALVREIRREAEMELVHCLKSARAELEALRRSVPDPGLEHEEFGQLEEI